MALASIIMAAGFSTRMRSGLPKALHPLAGRPLISYPIEVARRVGAKPICVVIGRHQTDLHKVLVGEKVLPVFQANPRGTADAVLATRQRLHSFKGYVLILSGDVPLITRETIKAFVDQTVRARASLGMITMHLEDAAHYGRVLRDLDRRVVKVVEVKEASEDELAIHEVNAGIYCVEKEWLFETLKKVRPAKTSGEYYLPAMIPHAIAEGRVITAYRATDADEFLGVNTRVDLSRVLRVMRRRMNRRHMLSGVGILNEEETWIDDGVTIGEDTTIWPGSFLLGQTRVGKGCTLETGVVLVDALLSDHVYIKSHSVIESSRIGRHAVVGPFAHISAGTVLEEGAEIGNFVEVKRSRVGIRAKAKHLSYLGDALLGRHVNIGAGTITANYDGFKKHASILKDGVQTGSNTVLVAPITMGKGAKTGAGAVVTKGRVSPGAMVVGVPAIPIGKRKTRGLLPKRK